jgi:recombination protein RecT
MAAAAQKKQQHVTQREQVREVEHSLKLMRERLVSALPAHIPVQSFIATVLTACSVEPKLLRCDRQSLFLSCLKAARDGLLPDGREAALVPFLDAGVVIVATYMPMVAGLLKKVRNSGELASFSANPVFAEDVFEYELGDAERIVHKPAWRKERGPLVGAYAIARTKDGNVYRRVLGLQDIELIKAFSKAKKGPWHGPFESEMWVKSAIRRLSKILPQSSDINQYLMSGPKLPADEAGSVLPDALGEEGTQSVEFELRTRAILELRESGVDPESLAGIWTGVKSEYEKIGVEIPLELEDVYNMQKEALAEENRVQ